MYKISKPLKSLKEVEINLPSSKSISNRALIIQALCAQKFKIENVSTSHDTTLLTEQLKSNKSIKDAGHAGTVYRFLTAFLSIQLGEHILTGTERMKQRPIGILVEALKKIGADISYLEKTGYPPLRIRHGQIKGGKIKLSASVSSQYISALMMIGPTLQGGLEIYLEGEVVSTPYIIMTQKLMRYFGIDVAFDGQCILVKEGAYVARDFFVEGDWSSASYFYTLVALGASEQIDISNLYKESIQGDQAIVDIARFFGIQTHFTNKGISIRKQEEPRKSYFEYDFVSCPDLAQTVAVLCAAKEIEAKFEGLQTLKIKETNRVAALQNELIKFGFDFYEQDNAWYLRRSKKHAYLDIVQIKTYEDHRMAMAFAPMAMLYPNMIIENPNVVVKSNPDFWKQLQKIGFVLEK